MIGRLKLALAILKENRKALHELDKVSRENYWANVFRNATQSHPWINQLSLNVGRWAASYSLLYILFRVLNEAKPTNILEFGLGESTKVFNAYKESVKPEACCVTVEHDQTWIDQKLRTEGLQHVQLVKADLGEIEVNSQTTLGYSNLTESLGRMDKKFNLVLVDGPFGSDAYSRPDILDIIKADLLDTSFVIIMDDFERAGERQTVDLIKQLLTDKEIPHCVGEYSGDKGQVLITVPELQFLTSL